MFKKILEIKKELSECIKPRLDRDIIITKNLKFIEEYYNADFSQLNYYQIASIIMNDYDPFCECGKLKDWNQSRLKNNCISKECSDRERKKSNLKKYGCSHPSQSKEVREKVVNTFLKNYGETNPGKSKIIQDKMKKTCLEKYGVDNIFKKENFIEEYKIKNPNKHIQNEDLFTYEYFSNNFIKDEELLLQEAMNFYNYKTPTQIYLFCAKHNIKFKYKTGGGQSLYELNFQKIFSNYNITNNSRKIIDKEIDIYFNDYNLGIEINGIYWHSYGKNNINPSQFDKKFQKNRHFNKTKSASDNNILLFHIFENELLDDTKYNIWLSMINNKLGLSNKIYARKCIIKEIKSSESNLFIFNNHMQGIRNAEIKLGLLYDNELVSVMTFGKPLQNLEYEYELIRFCNKLNTNVIGAASKLLKYFEKNYKPTSIISYANRRWSNGDLYKTLNFKCLGETEPNKFIISDKKLYSRINFQKHKLKDKLKIYDDNLTADENIINNDYRIIWDSGNFIFGKLIHKEY